MKMKVITSRITLIGATVGMIALLAPGPATAQITPQSSPSIGGQDNSSDLDFLDKPEGGSSASLLNLMNRVRMLQEYSPQEFTAEQSKNLDAAAAQFRAQQLQQIQNAQQQTTNSAPTVKLVPAP